ncbi:MULTISPECIES: hypothetical protein [Cupriavidus]|uniref:Lipoprotein n=1 Tax=Cupriavidus pauculus TaxID=82633 RepID=A0A3G8H5V3_9BURK|nr:hypothetical protein [Cupriavidus pauculus]AZG15575.1 hypothetical protein EHF44_19045 [Cupriavidus pauculus]
MTQAIRHLARRSPPGLLAAVLLCAALAACGGDSDSPATPGTPGTPNTPGNPGTGASTPEVKPQMKCAP